MCADWQQFTTFAATADSGTALQQVKSSVQHRIQQQAAAGPSAT